MGWGNSSAESRAFGALGLSQLQEHGCIGQITERQVLRWTHILGCDGPGDPGLSSYVCVCVCTQPLSHIQLFVTPWAVARQASLSMEFPRGKNTGMGCHFLP